MNPDAIETADPRIPLTLLTGFLGSGKTTVLNQLLQHPSLADTAVIINEFGEIGLDHLLVDHVSEHLLVLNSGCLCCTVRGDLVQTLAELQTRRASGEIAFSRVIVETTGLADPAPVLHTLMAEPAVARDFQLAGVVTTVDAFNGADTLDRHPEAVKQAAVADVLLLTKTDLGTEAGTRELADRLHRLNPGATQVTVRQGAVSPQAVLRGASVRPEDFMAAWPGIDAHEHEAHGRERHEHDDHDHDNHAHDSNRHDAHISAYCFSFDEPVASAALDHWITLMVAMRGEQLLRVKGLVRVAEHPDQPLVLHGVQHLFHPPRRLPAWPDQDRRTRIVFITRDIGRDEIARTFAKFAGARPAA